MNRRYYLCIVLFFTLSISITPFNFLNEINREKVTLKSEKQEKNTPIQELNQEDEEYRKLAINSPIEDEVIKAMSNIQKISNNKPIKTIKKVDYVSHPNITIRNNTDFTSQAITNGWVGSGSQWDPYIIENYDITDITYMATLIHFENVSVHFIVRNCWLEGGGFSILLNNTSNGYFINNTFFNATDVCLNIESSSVNNTVRYNTFNVTDDNHADCENASNTFAYNYYGNCSVTDSNNDGINDSIFNIEGGFVSDDTPRVFAQYWSHLAIDIETNEDLDRLASDEGLWGDGTSEHPFVFSDLNITGSGSTCPVKIVNTTKSILFDNCTFFNGSYGLYLRGTANIKINNSHILNSTNIGIYLANYEPLIGQNITVSNCHFKYEMVNSGIRCEGIEDSIFSNNTVENINGYGFWFISPTNMTVFNSTVQFCNGYGIFLQDCNNTTITKSKVLNATNRGLYIWNSDYTFISNFISKNTTGISSTYGLYSLTSNFCSIYNSSFSNALFGIYVAHSNNYTIDGVTINFSTYYGLYFGDSNNVIIRNCIINNNSYGVYINNLKDIFFENCSIYSNSYGIYSPSSSNYLSKVIITNTTVANNTKIGLQFEHADHISLKNTSITENGSDGLYSNSINNLTLVNTIITNNSGCGLFSVDSINLIISNCIFRENSECGILFQNVSCSLIVNSTLSQNTKSGLTLKAGLEINVTRNKIENNEYAEIFLDPLGNTIMDIQIALNIIRNNGFYGFINYETNQNIIITNNSFIDNGRHSPLHTSQGFDNDGTHSNLYQFNYWSDYQGIDANHDGIGDTPYSLDGFAGNEDTKPNMNPTFKPSYVDITITQPISGVTLAGVAEIIWSVNDTSDVWTYLIKYRTNDENTWKELVTISSSASTVNYDWDTTKCVDSRFYKISVTITTSDVLGTGITDGYFTVDNDPSYEEIVNETTFDVSLGISITIDISSAVNVSVKKISTAPSTPSNLNPLNIYIDITLSNDSALTGLWINITFTELGSQDPENVRLYYYNEDSNQWEKMKKTGVDYDREVVYGFTDHVTVFGVMDEKSETPDDNWLFIVVFAVILILVVCGIGMSISNKAKKEQLKDKKRKY